MSGCTDSGPEAELTAIIEDVMAAADVDVETNYISGYARKSADGTVACGDRPEDERWYDRQTGRILSGRQSQQRIYDGVLGYLRDHEYEVTRFEPVAAADRSLAVLGTKDELAVRISVLPDGNSSIGVYAGPCAIPFAGFSDNLYRRVD